MSGLGMRVTVLERTGRVAPLGIRFWDGAAAGFVGGGLDVRALRADRPDVWVAATASSAGVYGFAALPGLSFPKTFGEGDDAYWLAVRQQQWVVEVRDPLGRYLPVWFMADAPARGLFAGFCPGSPLLGSPPGNPVGSVPLFSAPARPVPAGMAVLRAELRGAGGGPAAYALVEVTPPQGASALALADARGAALALFPWPAPERTLGSPLSPLASAAPLWQQTWQVGVAASWSGPASPLEEGPPALIDLCAALTQPAALLRAPGAPLAVITSVALGYGIEAILRAEVG